MQKTKSKTKQNKKQNTKQNKTKNQTNKQINFEKVYFRNRFFCLQVNPDIKYCPQQPTSKGYPLFDYFRDISYEPAAGIQCLCISLMAV